MGNLKTEGQAINATAPAGQEIIKGELYRYNKWNGFAMTHVLPTDPEQGFALEVGLKIWYVQAPSGLVANQGDTLYWSAGEGFKKSPTDLVAAGTAGAIGPACKVEEAIDANFVVGVRALNVN